MNNFERYKMLDNGVPTDISSVPAEFVLHKDGALKVVWAPCDHINDSARIAIVGITPGWQQAQIAYTEAQKALKKGLSYSEACKRAKGQAAFAGTMRKNLISMLDDIGVGQALGITSTVELFGRSNRELHSTSALRYPVFCNNKNYTGHIPDPFKNDYLRSMTETLLTEELSLVSSALVVPLGKAANVCVKHALSICHAEVYLLDMFPHPSEANAHRIRQFKEQKKALTKIVQDWQTLPNKANSADAKSRTAD
jgi:hypothetical protein